jgi:hypothetical protein
MSNAFDRLSGIAQMCFGPGLGNNTKTGFALGSAYSYGVAGAALALRFVAPTTGNLTDVWFFVTTTTGAGNPPGITTVELRNYSAAGTPGTTLHASQTITPGTTDNKWINAHFTTPYSVTRGIIYFVVLGDAGWTSGHTATVDSVGILFRNFTANHACGVTTANGFSTAGTVATSVPAMVLKFADGSYLGQPFTTTGAYTNNTLERGIKIAGLTEDVWIDGIMIMAIAANISGLKIYKGTTAPGGTTELTVTFGTGGGTIGGAYFAPFKLLKNTIYRIVLTYGGNSTAPGTFVIEDYATGGTDLTNAGFGGGTMFGTIDHNDGTWADSIDIFPQMALIIQDQSVQPGALIDGGAIAT